MIKPNQIYFEPYKIKMVEAISVVNPLTKEAIERRETILEQARYNVFSIPAEEVCIDLLTDSGTGTMSQDQWSAMMVGDESYAQAKSFFRFNDAVREVIGEQFFIIPTHQGRAAENILFYVLNDLAAEHEAAGHPLKHRVVINSFFDTTASNVMLHGKITEQERKSCGIASYTGNDYASARIVESNIKRCALIERNQLAVDQLKPEQFEHDIFGGNIDLDRLEAILADDAKRAEVMIVMLTVTNNTGGGLPVSMANIRAVREMIDHYSANDEPMMQGLPPIVFFLDACRFAENAYFIQQYEPGYRDRSVADIALEMFSLVDGCTMSAKKDGMANIGGFLACRHEMLREHFWEFMVEIEGFYTYGGLAGRDLEAVAVGIKEGVAARRVEQRVQQVRQLWSWLKDEGIPVKEPCGGHGVYLRGRAFWSKDGKPLVDNRDLPGHLLAIELYRRYCIRGCEIGTIMFGDYNPETGRPDKVAHDEDYVRLAIPRRVYTASHMEYVAASICELYDQREKAPWRGMKFTYRALALPHFLSHFEPIRK